MSHIQVELDALNKAASIANAARVGREWVVTGLNDMWAHCFREKTNEVTPVQLVGFFTVDAGPALEAFGFLEKIDAKTWRVRGTGRYTSLTEKRKAAGSKGGKATASSKNSVRTAKTTGATEAKAEAAAFAQANGSKRPENPSNGQASAQANGVANTENPLAKAALDPRSEISPPSGERYISEIGSSARARVHGRRPPPDGGGDGTTQGEPGESSFDAKPVKPPRPQIPPTPRYGTPEYRLAVQLDNWELLAWKCYPGETEVEREERGRENASLYQAEMAEKRAAERRKAG